ncbi:tRNA (guanine(37)-N1)-methyltransferase [Podosphaera aphanis]|nr:tRNA (guanine(37)-N1)-methyltransferase [Podosphaera aphanis]
MSLIDSSLGRNKMSLFRPPTVRTAISTLDRSLFSRAIPLAAARIQDPKNISLFRSKFGKTKEILKLDRFLNVRPDPDPEVAARGGKCVILAPEVKPEEPATWSRMLQEAVEAKEVKVLPYNLRLDYDYWDYMDIMTAALPEDAQGEIPVGFAIVGHVAHLNLREEYHPFKKFIAEVLIDKNPRIRTVINKIEDVGEQSEYRTFRYEVLAGPDDMNVELSEGGCVFKFDYSKVYWNSRLQTEHKRLVDAFNPGEVVVDVMAGIGPFALPAGKKKVFVWANDLNPESYKSLAEGIKRNKVDKFVRPFCQDGRRFIHHVVSELLHLKEVDKNFVAIPAQRMRQSLAPTPPPQIIPLPLTPSHFIMNLPATAIEFCDAFEGLYAGREKLFEPYTERSLPMVHVHCFSTKSKDNVLEAHKICERLSQVMKTTVRPRFSAGNLEGGEVYVHDVREVSPKKRMFCAQFRIPHEVAFRKAPFDVGHNEKTS